MESIKKFVLFVDDDEQMRAATNRQFTRRSIPITLFDSGEAALMRSQDLSIEHGSALRVMLVTDGFMESMRGDDLIASMRSQIGFRLAAAILVTGDAHRFRARAESEGYQLWEKPCDMMALIESVCRFLSSDAPDL